MLCSRKIPLLFSVRQRRSLSYLFWLKIYLLQEYRLSLLHGRVLLLHESIIGLVYILLPWLPCSLLRCFWVLLWTFNTSCDSVQQCFDFSLNRKNHFQLSPFVPRIYYMNLLINGLHNDLPAIRDSRILWIYRVLHLVLSAVGDSLLYLYISFDLEKVEWKEKFNFI